MKKFLYAAVMALTVAFMASCGGSPTSYKYADGENPDINVVNGTVNGHEYDTKTECCWKVTYTTSSATIVEYEWTNEFLVVAGAEAWVAEWNHMGYKAGYSYIKWTAASTEEACEGNNSDE